MKIENFITRYSTNVYVLYAPTATIVVDAGGNTDEILRSLEQEGRRVDYVLLTHGHYDHTLDCARLASLGAEIFMNKSDDFLLKTNFLGIQIPPFEYTDIYDGQVLELGGIEFRVLATPGHTPGSVCFVTDGLIFSGDTLFKGTVGRTDFPRSSTEDLMKSLDKLASLEGMTVLPGHGEKTTVETEKRINPFMKR